MARLGQEIKVRLEPGLTDVKGKPSPLNQATILRKITFVVLHPQQEDPCQTGSLKVTLLKKGTPAREPQKVPLTEAQWNQCGKSLTKWRAFVTRNSFRARMEFLSFIWEERRRAFGILISKTMQEAPVVGLITGVKLIARWFWTRRILSSCSPGS